MIQFDKSFHPVVQYENYPICIFMNINENIKMRVETRLTSISEGNQTCIEHLVHFLMDANWFNGTTKIKKIYIYCPKYKANLVMWYCIVSIVTYYAVL